ncbi:MAG: MBL fold metallo-hydrolase, partial [Deltaproteobacteria bacterium]|nr:MBL fold metallo-hydrolase [Deltaproteobacteria bacterium]
DHAGGSTRKNKQGKLEPTFPNAAHYIQKENLDWANNPTEKDRASYLKEDWQPLQAAGLLKIIDGEKEILPGIQVRKFYGHTKGIQLPLLDDDKTKLFFCGDVIPTSVHLGIPWVMAYDLFPLTTMEEKKKILEQAAKENWILVFEHCPHTGATRIKAVEKGFELAEQVSL